MEFFSSYSVLATDKGILPCRRLGFLSGQRRTFLSSLRLRDLIDARSLFASFKIYLYSASASLRVPPPQLKLPCIPHPIHHIRFHAPTNSICTNGRLAPHWQPNPSFEATRVGRRIFFAFMARASILRYTSACHSARACFFAGLLFGFGL